MLRSLLLAALFGASAIALGAQQPLLPTDTLPQGLLKLNANDSELYALFPVSQANGGTGGTSAATARTALGLAIGTNVQAWDADLDLWAGKTAPSGVVIGTTDTQTLTNKSISGGQITSAVATATALAANGANCSAGNYPLGVDASGAVEDCTAVPSVPTAANPTGTIGLTAVPGSAATFPRSDSAPALSQAIVPAWTGIHTWSLAEPRLVLSETDQASDEKMWDWDAQAKVMCLRTRTDADGAGINIFCSTRGTGTAISNISLGNATNNPTGTWLGTGEFTFSGVLTAGVAGTTAAPSLHVSNTSPIMMFTDSNAGTNLTKYILDARNGDFRINAINDAANTVYRAYAFTRGTATVTGHTWYTGNSVLKMSLDSNGNLITVGATVDQSKVKITPTTGFSQTIANNTTTLIIDPAGTLATGTITMPATPIDGQNVRFTTSQIITALTVNPNSGQSIVGAPTTLSLGQGAAFIYELSNTTWYRLYLGN